MLRNTWFHIPVPFFAFDFMAQTMMVNTTNTNTPPPMPTNMRGSSVPTVQKNSECNSF